MIISQPALLYHFTLRELLELTTPFGGEGGKHSRAVATQSDRIASVMIASVLE